MNVRLGLPLVALLAMAGGCEQATEQRRNQDVPFGSVELETRTFALEHLSESNASSLVEPYVYADRPGAPGVISYAANRRAISVRETPDNLDKIVRMLERFDVDTRSGSYRLHFQIVAANGVESVDARLAPIEEELRKVFRFDGYSLIGQGYVINAAIGSFDLQIGLDPSAEAQDQQLRMHIEGAVYPGNELGLTITDYKPRTLSSDRWEGRIMTRLGFRVGQTLVLGSMPTQNRTVFVVVNVTEARSEPA